MSLTYKVIFGITTLALASCSHTVADFPQPRDSAVAQEQRLQIGQILDKEMVARRRLIQTAGPILLANANLCPRKAMTLGFETISDFDLPKDMQNVAYENVLLNSDAMVLGVVPKSQAWHAGIQHGDIVLILNGKRVRNAADWRARMRKLKSDAPVQIGLMRQRRAYEVSLNLVPFCNYRLLYESGNQEINAASTGTSISVNQGMMDFTNDDELALIIGHELAHNIMHHIKKMQTTLTGIQVAAEVIDTLTGYVGAGGQVRTLLDYLQMKFWFPPLEKEADYVGLYLVARAEGNIDGAAELERRFGVVDGVESMTAMRNPLWIRSHPMSTDRAVSQSVTIAEIHEKQRKGQELMPNLRNSWNYGQKYSWWDVEEEEPWVDDDLNH